ncbi:MAG: T9SS type A sorting domain-containing protein, partial [candidate division WOR-3 bacterium]
IPPGTTIPCTLFVTGDSADYATRIGIRLIIGEPPVPGQLLMTHDTGYCKLTISCQGSIGFDIPDGSGAGFCYPKSAASALYYASFALGNSASYVADHHYGNPASGPTNTDLRPIDSLRPVTPPEIGDEHFRGSYSDAGHPAPKGLKITQNTYMSALPGYDDFVVMVFDITNQGSNPVNGLYAGIFSDFDIGSSSTANTLFSDTIRRFTYMRQSSSANPTVGIKILAPQSYANLSGVDHAIYVYPDSAMTDNMKWRFLNGTIVQRNSNRAYDWSVLVSAGPFDLNIGQNYRFAVAFVGGTDESSARANADSAQSWFDRNVAITEPQTTPHPAAPLLALTPNPFSRNLTLRFQNPQAQPVKITLHDIAGRTLHTIYQETAPPGPNQLHWSPRNLTPGVYFIRLQAPNLNLTERAVLIR